MPFAELAHLDTVPSRSKSKTSARGCDVCPLNKVHGIRKIMGSMKGREILIVAQSPGPEENDVGKELIGRSGQLLWNELKKVGISRSDCDIQNVVRCFPADVTEGSYNTYLKMRSPSAAEIKCCSIYTENAMKESKARHILILGQVAAKAFLNTRSIPQQKIFWSHEHNAKVYLADHPAFFVRGYGAGDRLNAFRGTLQQLADGWGSSDSESASDSFAFMRKQDYRLVLTGSEAAAAEKLIRKYAPSRRIAVDIEYDTIDDEMRIFAVGFSPKPGLSLVFVTGHPDQDEDEVPAVWKAASRLLIDPQVRKVFHFGCSDVMTLAERGVNVQGYDWDTLFAEYCFYPDAKKYGLAAIAERRFQQFSGYKNVVVADLMTNIDEDLKVPAAVKSAGPEGQLKWIFKNRQYRLSRLSLDTLRLYNGADTDLTKRIEVDTKKKIPHALVKLYMDLSFVLRDMEPNGPLFDAWQHKKMNALYPILIERALKKIRKMTKDPEFNPASPKQVFNAVYHQFGLVYPLSKGKPNTQKKTMMMLSREHKFPGAVIEWRKLDKAKSTYIDGQLACAESNGGKLRTTWWSTGTRTGRLSSSAGDVINGVNLQNLHGDPHLRNMLCADLRWRKVFNAIASICRKHYVKDDSSRSFKKVSKLVERWIRENAPDLKTFLVLDYGQVEVRVMAQMSGDKNLLHDCMSSDIHSKVGVTMTGWDIEAIRHDKKTRTLTKNVHFGIIFGIEKNNLFEFIKAMDPSFDGTQEMVFEAYDRYFERYPGVRDFMDKQRAFALEHGYVETMFGLRQPLNIDSKADDDDDLEFLEDPNARHSSWRNQAVNGPVQGTAHQLMECALVNIKRKPTKYEVLGVPSMEVHDALYNIVEVLRLPEAYEKARHLLEKESLKTVKSDFPDIKWKVPIATEAEAGLRLGCQVELHEGFTAGEFMLRWFFKARAQMLDLEKMLTEAAA